jgi:hypothetical protein
MVTRLDRLARSTRDLLNTLAAIAGKGAGFRSLGDTWADTTTPHGRLMLIVLGGLAEFEREPIQVRTGEGRRSGQGARREARAHTKAYAPPEARGDPTPRRRRGHARDRAQLQRQPQHDFEAVAMSIAPRQHYPRKPPPVPAAAASGSGYKETFTPLDPLHHANVAGASARAFGHAENLGQVVSYRRFLVTA